VNTNQKLLLTFESSKLEKSFKKSHDEKLRKLLRIGTVQSMVSWFFGLILLYTVVPEYFFKFLVIILLAVYVPFLSIRQSTFSKKFNGHFHELAAASNVIAGLLTIYLCHFLPNGENIMLMLLIFIIFFGNYMYRLRLFMSSLVTLTYISAFQLYILYFRELETTQIILLSFVAWLTESFAIVAGYISEKNQRISFIQQKTIKKQKKIIQKEKEESEKLLLNILPALVVKELKSTGKSEPKRYKNVSILFTDFVGFTELVSSITAITLVEELNTIFSHFDDIMEEVGIEKIETIGDAYLAACGLPEKEPEHAQKCVLAAKKMLFFLENRNENHKIQWKMRVGIHSGSVVAGVVGKKKFAYDVFGDTINTASRIESSCEPGKINISAATYKLIKKHFKCTYRGEIPAKGKGDLDMYFVD